VVGKVLFVHIYRVGLVLGCMRSFDKCAQCLRSTYGYLHFGLQAATRLCSARQHPRRRSLDYLDRTATSTTRLRPMVVVCAECIEPHVPAH